MTLAEAYQTGLLDGVSRIDDDQYGRIFGPKELERRRLLAKVTREHVMLKARRFRPISDSEIGSQCVFMMRFHGFLRKAMDGRRQFTFTPFSEQVRRCMHDRSCHYCNGTGIVVRQSWAYLVSIFTDDREMQAALVTAGE